VADTNSSGVVVTSLIHGCAAGANTIGNAYAKADSGGLGVYADYQHFCCSTAGGTGAEAGVKTDFMITGPAGPVMISLNLVLQASFGGGIGESDSTRQVDMTVDLGSNHFFGTIAELARPPSGGLTIYKAGNLVVPGNSCLTPCLIPTQTVTLLANTLYTFQMYMHGTAGGGTGNSVGSVQAFDTLYFPKTGPVFNLPDGYSAIINGLNVEGNRVIGQENEPGGVTEPSTCALLAAGLALLTWARSKHYKGGLG
jgi:hypothetical protein